jgi:hypothetical protein
MNDIDKIRKRHKDNESYIAKREKQGRWWWMDMHQRCHEDRATLLAKLSELEKAEEDSGEYMSIPTSIL